MRISTANRYDASVETLQRRQAELDQTQEQMSSGKRINRTSDDPTAAARAERAYIAQERIKSQQRSVEASRNNMQLAESALGQAGDLLQSVRETFVAAGDASYGKVERAALAKQLQQLRGQLLSLANQGDGAGGYTFGGQGSASAPFLDGVGGVVASPGMTGGQAEVSASEQMPIAVDGQNIWLSARSGNGVFVTAADPANTGTAWIDAGGVSDPSAITGASYDIAFFDAGGGQMAYNTSPGGVVGATYVPGQAIVVDGMTFKITGKPADGDRFTITPAAQNLNFFDSLDAGIKALQDPNVNPGQVSQVVSNGLRDVDAFSSHVMGARAVAGATLQRLDSIESRNQDRTLWAKSVQSAAEDVDMVQAVSDFKTQQTSYQAALQSYAMVQRMSLFDYIK